MDVTNKFPNVTGSLLDGYLKAEAKSRCINIFRYDLHADTVFVTRNFKIKSEQFIDGMVEIGIKRKRAE